MSNYKIINFNKSYDKILKIMRISNDKNHIITACNIYTKLNKLELQLKKQFEKLEELYKNHNKFTIDPNYTDTEEDYTDTSVDTKKSIEVKF